MTQTTKRLVTLEEHQAFLKEVLATAKERVVIVSPFISSKAINDDNLSTLVKQAVARGVQIKIFVDYKLNTIDGEIKLSAKEGIADMVKSGARVYVADGIHNKTLICNNDLIAEGSFNWLSAVRVKNGENQREERTFVYTGPDAGKMIEQELSSIESVSYGEAGIKAKDEHSESYARLGRLALLGAILVAPLIGGSDIIQKVGGFILTGLVLGGYFGLIWLRNRLLPESAEESHQTAGFDDDSDTEFAGPVGLSISPIDYSRPESDLITGGNHHD